MALGAHATFGELAALSYAERARWLLDHVRYADAMAEAVESAHSAGLAHGAVSLDCLVRVISFNIAIEPGELPEYGCSRIVERLKDPHLQFRDHWSKHINDLVWDIACRDCSTPRPKRSRRTALAAVRPTQPAHVRKARDAVVRREQPGLLTLIADRLGKHLRLDDGLARDIAQDVWTDVLRYHWDFSATRCFQAMSSFRTLLGTIAIRRVSKTLGDRPPAKPVAGGDGQLNLIAAPQALVNAALDRVEFRQALDECLEQVSLKYRTIAKVWFGLMLDDFGSRITMKEVGEQSGLTDRQIYNILGRAAKQLRDCLDRKGFSPVKGAG